MQTALRHWERAYAVFRKRPDPEQTVLAAFYLCLASTTVTALSSQHAPTAAVAATHDHAVHDEG